jgi:4-deoxy-L-threo-5-hexosulose-uronate ketol-isomerase
MEVRPGANPVDVKGYDTARLRHDFLVQDMFNANEVKTVYSQIDRIIIGAAMPVDKALKLEAGAELRAKYFLERREMGIINIGGKGTVTVDGKAYDFKYRDGMYVGMGAKEIVFSSADSKEPAKFYFNSAPAHKTYPTVFIDPDKDILPQNKLELGTLEDANHRILRKYILPGQVESCQLEMGITTLEPGSVWNTMPCHTHDRRMEVYLYFELPENAAVFHYMGEPQETRHIIMHNEEAVISPSWSIHSASATHAYAFIWGMVGENQDFDDMDGVDIKDLR